MKPQCYSPQSPTGYQSQLRAGRFRATPPKLVDYVFKCVHAAKLHSFCAFILEHSLTFQVTFWRFTSSVWMINSHRRPLNGYYLGALLFNSRTAIVGAIIGLLLVFYFVVKIFVTTIWRHNPFKSPFCSFVHAISTEVRVWRHFCS